MTQLQTIIEELKSINPDTDLGQAWKTQAYVNPVKVIHEIKYGIKHNYESAKDAVSGRALLLIAEFDALNEAEIQLGELTKHWKLPRVSRDFAVIRKLIADIELLFKISEL